MTSRSFVHGMSKTCKKKAIVLGKIRHKIRTRQVLPALGMNFFSDESTAEYGENLLFRCLFLSFSSSIADPSPFTSNP